MSKSKVLATLIALVSSTSLCLADGITCPTQSALNGNHVKELATTGKTTIGSTTYELVGKKKTGTDFNGKLLDTAKHLEGFVKVTGHTVSKLQQTDARAVSIHKTPNVANKDFCAYSISMGTANAVVALEAASNPPPVPARTYLPPSEPPPLPPARVESQPQPKSAEPEAETEASPQSGGGLLAEIQRGKKLKHVEQKPSEPAANPSTQSAGEPSTTANPTPTRPAPKGQGMSMMDELQMKMKARQQKQTD